MTSNPSSVAVVMGSVAGEGGVVVGAVVGVVVGAAVDLGGTGVGARHAPVRPVTAQTTKTDGENLVMPSPIREPPCTVIGW